MKDAKSKVLEMVERKKISPDEGETLLAAMSAKPKFSLGALFNPFPQLSEPLAVALAIVAALAGVAVSMTMGIRFDGFLDIHAPTSRVTWTVAALDQLVSWPLAALVLWGLSLPFSRQGRIIDFISGVGVARAVQLLGGASVALLSPPPQVALQLAEKAMKDPTAISGELISFIPMILAAIIFISWFITANVFAMKHATGLKGGKLAAVSVLGILLAETVSKLALAAFPL